MKNSIYTLSVLLSISIFLEAQDVEEVIVTATKTEKTLQEVPIAVSVVTADVIEKANVVDILTLNQSYRHSIQDNTNHLLIQLFLLEVSVTDQITLVLSHLSLFLLMAYIDLKLKVRYLIYQWLKELRF